MHQARPSRNRRGFTLVELLVVITIIGILVALLIPTVGAVTRRVRNAAMAVELQELSRAVEAYKAKMGDYPPDFTYQTSVANHVRRAHPRNTRNVIAWLSNPINPSLHPGDLDPAEALVFWLSMTRNNPRDPLGPNGEPVVFFDFEPSQLRDIDGDNWQEYYPNYGQEAPYVYFDGRVVSVTDPTAPGQTFQTYAYAWTVYPSPYSDTYLPPPQPARKLERSMLSIPNPSAGAIGIVRPYRSNRGVSATETRTWQNVPLSDRTEWMAPGAFQIICAGLDSHFGVAEPSTFFKTFPTPNYYTNGTDITPDEDNLANFSEMKTFGDSVP